MKKQFGNLKISQFENVFHFQIFKFSNHHIAFIRTFTHLHICTFFIGLFILCFTPIHSARSQSDALAVVANSETGIAELPFRELQSILKGEKQRWKDGSKISLALLKTNTSLGGVISKKVYDMSADQMNKYWLTLVFQGKATAPVFFESEEEVKAFVSRTKGALGVIGYEEVKNEKVILIDGKKFF